MRRSFAAIGMLCILALASAPAFCQSESTGSWASVVKASTVPYARPVRTDGAKAPAAPAVSPQQDDKRQAEAVRALKAEVTPSKTEAQAAPTGAAVVNPPDPPGVEPQGQGAPAALSDQDSAPPVAATVSPARHGRHSRSSSARAVEQAKPSGGEPASPASDPAGPNDRLKTAKDRPDKMALVARFEHEERRPAKQGPGIARMALSTVLKLALVLALAYLTILVLKWLSVRKDVLPRTRRDLKIVDTVRLSSTSSLHLVDLSGKRLLVGCSTGEVNLLRELEDEEPAEAIPAEGNRFAEYLAKYSGPSLQNGPAARIGGLLRDCAGYLKNRRQIGTRAGLRKAGESDEG